LWGKCGEIIPYTNRKTLIIKWLTGFNVPRTESIQDVGKFRIKFKGITASKLTIMIQGFYGL